MAILDSNKIPLAAIPKQTTDRLLHNVIACQRTQLKQLIHSQALSDQMSFQPKLRMAHVECCAASKIHPSIELIATHYLSAESAKVANL